MGVRYIGIDPGTTGAIAMLDAAGLVRARPRIEDLPTVDITARGRRKRRLHGLKLLNLLYALTDNNDREAFIGVEQVHAMPVNGSVGVFSQGHTMGAIETVLDILEEARPGIRRIAIAPHAWKKHYGLLGTKKDASRVLACDIFPAMKELERKKDHNRAEALLMAEYLRTEQIGIAATA